MKIIDEMNLVGKRWCLLILLVGVSLFLSGLMVAMFCLRVELRIQNIERAAMLYIRETAQQQAKKNEHEAMIELLALNIITVKVIDDSPIAYDFYAFPCPTYRQPTQETFNNEQ